MVKMTMNHNGETMEHANGKHKTKNDEKGIARWVSVHGGCLCRREKERGVFCGLCIELGGAEVPPPL